MTVRRLSLGFSVAGGALLVMAATALVSISLGRVGTVTADADGRMVTAELATPSILQSSPRVACGWIGASLVVAVVVALLIRYGGVIGPVLVLAVLWLLVMASILTIGIFVAPGAGLLSTAALLALVDHGNRHRPTRPAEPSTPTKAQQ